MGAVSSHLFSALSTRLTDPFYGMFQEGPLGDHRTTMWGRKDARWDHSGMHNQKVVPRALYLIVSPPPGYAAWPPPAVQFGLT